MSTISGPQAERLPQIAQVATSVTGFCGQLFVECEICLWLLKGIPSVEAML